MQPPNAGSTLRLFIAARHFSCLELVIIKIKTTFFCLGNYMNVVKEGIAQNLSMSQEKDYIYQFAQRKSTELSIKRSLCVITHLLNQLCVYLLFKKQAMAAGLVYSNLYQIAKTRLIL